MSGSLRSHGRSGFPTTAWRNILSYLCQANPVTSRARRKMMAMYVAKGVARLGEERTLIAMYVANDRAQSETFSTGNLLRLSLSGFSSTDRSNAHCRASGRRSPISTNAPSRMRLTKGAGMAKRPVLGSRRGGSSCADWVS